MKSNTRITVFMSFLLVIGMTASLCGGFAGGIIVDRSLLNRPKALAMQPTQVASDTPAPSDTPTLTPSGTPSPAPSETPQPSATATIEAAPSTGGINLDLLSEARQIIGEHYVDREAIDDKTLTYGAISGMVQALGDTGHSRFMSAEEYQISQNSLNGSYEGIGAVVESRNGQTVVVTPIDGSPAQKQGILPGDIIEKVDGVEVGGMPLEQVISRITGPAGTKVTLTILTPSTNTEREVTITRAKIQIQNVTWQALPGTTIAHLRLSQFSQGATDDIKKALAEIKSQNMNGIILDLRNNPGGLVSEVIGVTSQFLASGTVYQEKDVNGKVVDVPVKKGGLATQIPIVVLVNRGSASGAEIIAGAIQDAKRGQLIGETTFGTGTVLTQFPLSDGSVLILAIREWLTPNGRVIWHNGIVPDLPVKLELNVIPLTPQTERSMSADDLSQSKDAQLLKAIELLKKP